MEYTLETAVETAVDTTIKTVVPTQHQATARELTDKAGGGVKNVWAKVSSAEGALANKIQGAMPFLGETFSNIAAWATMGIASLLTLQLGSSLTGTFLNATVGEGTISNIGSNIGGIAFALKAGMVALNYLNGTGRFAPKQQADIAEQPPAPAGQ